MILLELQSELLQPCRGLVQASTGQDVRDRGDVRVDACDARILREITERSRVMDGPGDRGLLAGQDLQERGLAHPVTADQSHLVAGARGERGVLQHDAPTDLDRDVLDLQHGCSRVQAVRARSYTRDVDGSARQ